MVNEQIKQLYVQARREAGSENGFNTTNQHLYEKFAQLIVSECIQVCIADIADPRDTIEQKCAKKIKEHFVVKPVKSSSSDCNTCDCMYPCSRARQRNKDLR